MAGEKNSEFDVTVQTNGLATYIRSRPLWPLYTHSLPLKDGTTRGKVHAS